MEAEFLKWDESFQVGVAEIDAQHKKLFAIINSLQEAVAKEDVPANVVGDILFNMASYASEHFRSEQVYLEKHPDFKDHLLEHWDFTKKCMGLSLSFRKQSAVSQEALNFLTVWLREHVLEKDIRFFKELKG
ncbi:MAG: bacteriohemerythrin [Proteobacteria bacterium]|nr:bacteriohemerythrin [Pseudomonadota bacterium]MBU1715290.1 bacteriohemerythrin [Pseudomonadota bacterium]